MGSWRQLSINEDTAYFRILPWPRRSKHELRTHTRKDMQGLFFFVKQKDYKNKAKQKHMAEQAVSYYKY